MRVAMLSIDQTLVGGRKLGDAAARHIKYGVYVDSIDIIVYANIKDKLTDFSISKNVIGHPTNSIGKIFFLFDAIKIFKSIQKKHPIDLVICQSPFIEALIGCYLKQKYSLKLLIHFHGDFWRNINWLKERKLNYLFLLISKFVVSYADAIRVMSRGQKEKLVEDGIKADKIRVISTPINIKRFIDYPADETQAKLLFNLSSKKMQKNSTMILMVGRKDRVKDFETLFKVMRLVKKRYDKAELWVVGNYTNSELPKNIVHMTTGIGDVDSQNMPAYYKASYMTVLSSTSESFGKVLVEANACGKPVVSTATTGAKEIIKDGYNGYLVPIGDVQALAEKIVYLLEHKDVADEMGKKGQKLVLEKFSNNSKRVVNFWQDILK